MCIRDRAWVVLLLILARRLPSPQMRLQGFLARIALFYAVFLGMTAAQLLPSLEFTRLSVRASADYAFVSGGFPLSDTWQILLPAYSTNTSKYRSSSKTPVSSSSYSNSSRDRPRGGNYLGILTLVLAVVAVVGAGGKLRVAGGKSQGAKDGNQLALSQNGNLSDLQPATSDLRLVWLLAALALVSLLFAFGTPLYALLFYGVPGYKQLHSAFRWVFPYTVAMTALSGFGLQMLQNWLEGGKNTGQAGARAARSARTIARWIAGVTLVAGVVALAAALVSMLAPGPFAALGQRVVDSSDLARAVFANGQDFWGYQWRNVFHFGLFATLAGLWLLYATRNPRSADRDSRAAVPSWILPAAAILILVLDLFLVLGDFNPASDPDLLEITPQSIAVLQQDKDLWRVTSFEGPGTTKTLNANTAWLNGLQDVRGYDSIIPVSYTHLTLPTSDLV